MSFNWELYVQLADELINHQRNPELQDAYFRSAVSRSYYGVFGCARIELERRKISIPKKYVHKFVINKYKKSPNRTDKQIGIALYDLRDERNDADYEYIANFNSTRAMEAFLSAQNILKKLKALRTP